MNLDFRHIIIATSLSLLSGCGWVDATGVQGTDASRSNDAAIQLISDGGHIDAQEESTASARLTGQAALLRNWQWRPIDEPADPAVCASAGTQTELFANSLGAACTSLDACNLLIDESTINGDVRFDLRIPTLKAPLAAVFVLEASDDSGNVTQLRQTLCAASINEAPLAQNDRYIVANNQTRFVDADNVDGLLSNDSDDADVRNQPLSIKLDLVERPQFADEFDIREDGSFFYRAGIDVTIPENGITDRFVYTVTDGIHMVDATVELIIVDRNRPPELKSPIPDIRFNLEDDDDDDDDERREIDVDLSEFFEDPDGDVLRYRVLAGSLPSTGNLRLTANGRLQGVPEPEDAGGYRVTVVASDGIAEVSDSFLLIINSIADPNQPPTVSDIRNRIVQNRFSYDVSEFFDDPDGDPLTFDAQGLPAGVRISSQGVISGNASSANRGRWLIIVFADDGRGGSVADGFRLIVN